MLGREDLYARRCVEGLIQIVEQVPLRVAVRWPITLDQSSIRMMVLWTILRWERTFLLRCLEDMGVDMWGLTRELDDLLNQKRSAQAIRDKQTAASEIRSPFGPLGLDQLLNRLLDEGEQEARALQHPYLATEHLLLAIIAGADAELSSLLSRYAITHEKVKDAVVELLARRRPPEEFVVAEVVEPVRGPFGARWDTEAVGVPRRFGVGILLMMVTMYAVLFAAMQLLDTHLVVFTMVAILVTGVGLGQMLLFDGKYPRAASLWVGACLFPAEMLAVVLWLSLSPSASMRGSPAVGGMLCFLVFSVPLGALFGYLAGCLTAGAFLLIEQYKKKRRD